MVKNCIMVLCGLLAGLNTFAGDVGIDFQNALKLYTDGKYAEAEKGFVALYEQGNKAAMDACMQYAAYSAAKQKKDTDATAFAGKIKNKNLSLFCNMMILQEKNKWDEILALSKTEDIEKWPDALIYDALMCRGKAYLAKKITASAEKDFLNALKNTLATNDKAFTYITLAALYKDIDKNKQKATEAYGEVLKLNKIRFSILCNAAVERAKLLTAEGKGEMAIAELEKLDAPEKTRQAHIFSQVLFCEGEIYESLGKKDEALAKYKEVAGTEKTSEAMIDAAKKKITAIENKK